MRISDETYCYSILAPSAFSLFLPTDDSTSEQVLTTRSSTSYLPLHQQSREKKSSDRVRKAITIYQRYLILQSQAFPASLISFKNTMASTNLRSRTSTKTHTPSKTFQSLGSKPFGAFIRFLLGDIPTQPCMIKHLTWKPRHITCCASQRRPPEAWFLRTSCVPRSDRQAGTARKAFRQNTLLSRKLLNNPALARAQLLGQLRHAKELLAVGLAIAWKQHDPASTAGSLPLVSQCRHSLRCSSLSAAGWLAAQISRGRVACNELV